MENKDSFETAIIRFSLLSERKTKDDEPGFAMHNITHEAIRYRLNQQNKYLRAYFFSCQDITAIRCLKACKSPKEMNIDLNTTIKVLEVVIANVKAPPHLKWEHFWQFF